MMSWGIWDPYTEPMTRIPVVEPNLITGVGHGKPRGDNKCESYHKHKKKTARRMAKQSRRRNREG